MTRLRLVPAVVVASFLLAHCSSSTASLSPLQWQKVAGTGPKGSVLGFGAPGSFDEVGNFTISAFKDTDGTYRLYYGGADSAKLDPNCGGINEVHWRIGLATSPDGLNWTRVSGSSSLPNAKGAILDNGTQGQFDSFLTYRPYVLHDGSVYRMWYNGSTKPFFNCGVAATDPEHSLADDRHIGYAESPDGVHFTKMNNNPADPFGTAIPLGAAGAIDAQQVGYVWVIKDTNDYKMYYSANDAQNFWRVALATSTDAIHWTKVPGKLFGGAVLDLGPAGAYDVACAYQPSVFKESAQLYRMWYRGCQASRPQTGGPSQGVIGYAESNDGITWVKITQPGPFGAALGAGGAGTFDSGGLTTPSVFLDGNTWRMYYAGFDTGGTFLTGLAEAPNQ